MPNQQPPPFLYLNLDPQVWKPISERLNYLLFNELYKDPNTPPGRLPQFRVARPYTPGQEKFNILGHYFIPFNVLCMETLFEVVPELYTCLVDDLKVTVNYVTFLLLHKGNTNLHRDVSRHWPDCNLRINWPINNCETSKTTFYTVDEDRDGFATSIPNQPTAAYHTYSDQNITEELGHYILREPVVFNLTTVHRVTAIEEHKSLFDTTLNPRLLLNINISETDINSIPKISSAKNF